MKSILEREGIPKLKRVLKESETLSDVLRTYGLTTKGSANYKLLKRILTKHGMSYKKHLKRGEEKRREHIVKVNNMRTFKLKDILVENSTYTNTTRLKSRLIKASKLKNKCYECGHTGDWNGKPLCLQIDHINGVSNDNRLKNLRLLCPNCHSQSSTFSARNKKRVP